MKKYSLLMRFFLKLKLDSIAWSLRRLYCPVGKNDLVLEVGSGGNPYFRANILCDSYLETRERHYVPLITDRPTVLAFGEHLPFKDNAFDFVIASHVLEHSKNPSKFLSELQRVSRAGYIEVPDAFTERLTCYLDHRLEITDKNDQLIIRKKYNYIQDEEIRDLYMNKASDVIAKTISKKPFNFHVRYYWDNSTGGIDYKIINPNEIFDWQSPETKKRKQKSTLKLMMKQFMLKIARILLSQTKRNNKINLLSLLQCPICKKESLCKQKKQIRCAFCGKEYVFCCGNVINFTMD